LAGRLSCISIIGDGCLFRPQLPFSTTKVSAFPLVLYVPVKDSGVSEQAAEAFSFTGTAFQL
jgi:hypothetical protein